MQTFDVRELKLQDVPQVPELIRAGLDDEIFRSTIYSGHGYARYMERQLQLPELFLESRYYGAYAEEELIGFCEWRIRPKTMFLNNIMIKSQFQNAGVGGKLLAIGWKLAKEYGAERIELECFDSNRKALAWYERHGFQALTRQVWLRGRNPVSADRNRQFRMTVLNAPQAEVVQEAFGFSMLNVRTKSGQYEVGRIGRRYFRLASTSAFQDLDLLNELYALEPHRELLLICSEEQSPSVPWMSVICHSIRMFHEYRGEQG